MLLMSTVVRWTSTSSFTWMRLAKGASMGSLPSIKRKFAICSFVLTSLLVHDANNDEDEDGKGGDED